MSMATLDSLKKMQIISSDAYNVGEVVDIRYDPANWNVVGIRAKTEKSAAKMIAAGSGKSLIQIKPRDYVINDVMLMREHLSDLRNIVEQDTDNFPTLSFMEDKKVSSSEGLTLGVIQNVNIDISLWNVPSISVRLDKAAYDMLGLKKGLLAKTVIVIHTEYIQTASDVVTLNQNITDLRNEIIIE
jgi:hypothetical protein